MLRNFSCLCTEESLLIFIAQDTIWNALGIEPETGTGKANVPPSILDSSLWVPSSSGKVLPCPILAAPKFLFGLLDVGITLQAPRTIGGSLGPSNFLSWTVLKLNYLLLSRAVESENFGSKWTFRLCRTPLDS